MELQLEKMVRKSRGRFVVSPGFVSVTTRREFGAKERMREVVWLPRVRPQSFVAKIER